MLLKPVAGIHKATYKLLKIGTFIRVFYQKSDAEILGESFMLSAPMLAE